MIFAFRTRPDGYLVTMYIDTYETWADVISPKLLSRLTSNWLIGHELYSMIRAFSEHQSELCRNVTLKPTQIADFPQVAIVSITLENSKIEESHRIECPPLTLVTRQEEIQSIRRDHRCEQSSFF